ncbi:MAG: glutaminase, partial [Woeseiaceae bacterium]
MPSKTLKQFLLTSVLVVFASASMADSPTSEDLQRIVDEAHAAFKDVKEGANANYIPILDTVPSELFGIVIVTKDGRVFAAGDVDYRFSIQS